jgi:hypothetical protein
MIDGKTRLPTLSQAIQPYQVLGQSYSVQLSVRVEGKERIRRHCAKKIAPVEEIPRLRIQPRRTMIYFSAMKLYVRSYTVTVQEDTKKAPI